MKHFLSAFALVAALPACAADPDPAPTPVELALVRPPVEAVTPAGFLSGAKPASHLLDSADIGTRFFTNGPTDVFGVIDEIDSRITGYNTFAASFDIPCTTQEPVAYSIDALGETIPMFAQCYEDELDGTGAMVGFRQYGVADGTTYVYSQGVAGRYAAIVTADGADVYMAIGEDAHFNDQSYGVIRIHADEATGSFEMAVAGMGFGYCGAQLRSDGAEVYAIGSIDMGTTCLAADTLCVDAVDLTTPGTCDGLDAFDLAALGREADDVFGASAYPATPNITLDGTATDALHFGPAAPTAGVGLLMVQ